MAGSTVGDPHGDERPPGGGGTAGPASTGDPSASGGDIDPPASANVTSCSAEARHIAEDLGWSPDDAPRRVLHELRRDTDLVSGTAAAALALVTLLEPPATLADLTNSTTYEIEACAFPIDARASDWLVVAIERKAARNVTLELEMALRALAVSGRGGKASLDDIADIRESSSLRLLGAATARTLTEAVLLANAFVAHEPAADAQSEQGEPDEGDAARQELGQAPAPQEAVGQPDASGGG